MIATIRERLHAGNAEKLAEINRPNNCGSISRWDITGDIPSEIEAAIAADISADILDDIGLIYGDIARCGFDGTYREYDMLRDIAAYD